MSKPVYDVAKQSGVSSFQIPHCLSCNLSSQICILELQAIHTNVSWHRVYTLLKNRLLITWFALSYSLQQEISSLLVQCFKIISFLQFYIIGRIESNFY